MPTTLFPATLAGILDGVLSAHRQAHPDIRLISLEQLDGSPEAIAAAPMPLYGFALLGFCLGAMRECERRENEGKARLEELRKACQEYLEWEGD